MDPTSGLPDPAYQGFEKNARGRPAFRSPEGNLPFGTGETSGREVLGRELLEAKLNLIPCWWGEVFLGCVWCPWPVSAPWGRGGERWLFGRNHLGVLGSCQALLADFFPKIFHVLSFFHPSLQPGDTRFHKMICIVTTSLQLWHLQLQRPGAWRCFHHSFLWT